MKRLICDSMQYSEFKKNLIRNATEQNIPIIGEFELTANCNFRCSFCYLNHNKINPNLSTNEWKTIFKNAHEKGLMFANLTGGELFLRDDFIELFEYLYDLGVKITIFTNGSIIPKSVIQLFKIKKPLYVAITIYGYDEASYYEITKNKQAFINVKTNILQLKEQQINVILRTIPIQFIYQNIDNIIDFVKSIGMKLYFFSYVTKTNSCDFQNQRLFPKELINFENKIRIAFNYEIQPYKFEEDYKSCTALRSSYFINHLGEMMPCALAFKPKKSIITNDFIKTFVELGKEFKRLESEAPCFDCKFLNRCNTCYARRLNEEGYKSCALYLKEVASLRESYYKIGNLVIGLEIKYEDYFKNNIDKYLIEERINEVYHIKTHFVDKIELPKEKPTIKYKRRLIFQNDDSESLYALDEKLNVKEKFVRTVDYKKFDIYFAKDKEKILKEKEYIFTGIAFMDILSFNGYIPIHGSGIVQNDEAIIFSAPSQTGKSTMANNWLKLKEKSSVFNDDKPFIFKQDNKLYVSGSPWSGKDVINENIVLPLKTIIFLKQGKTNKITRLHEKDKIYYFFRNINRPKDKRSWKKMLETIDYTIINIPMYLAEITKDISAAKYIYDTIYGGIKNEN